MSRLTKRNADGTAWYNHTAEREVKNGDILEKLAHYEDLGEQGVMKWIPCSERLPEKENELYWTTHEDGSVILHGYTKSNGFIYNWEVEDLEKRKRQGGVVAWMLIPQPESWKAEAEAKLEEGDNQ